MTPTSRGRSVYVLTHAYPYEGEALFGVYATPQEADAAKDHKESTGSGGDWCTYEVEVGAKARYRSYDDRLENRDAT